MSKSFFSVAVMAAALTVGFSAMASPSPDLKKEASSAWEKVKDGASDVKDGTVKVAGKVKDGTVKTAKKVGNEAKKDYGKAKAGTVKVGKKVGNEAKKDYGKVKKFLQGDEPENAATPQAK